MSDEPHRSPLTEVVHDDAVNRLLEEIRRSVADGRPLVVRSADVLDVRRRFADAIHAGEQELHAFAAATLVAFYPELRSNLGARSATIEGRVPGTALPVGEGRREPPVIEAKLMVFGRCKNPAHGGLLRGDTAFDLAGAFLSDHDSALAAEHAPPCSFCGEKSQSIASFVQYKPRGGGPLRFLRTRIKSTSHIAYKVADIVFDIDGTFRRDKIRNEMTASITDVYGMKVIVAGDQDIPQALARLSAIEGTAVAEEKDYTGAKRKRSGFEAYKVVLRRGGLVIEAQLQSQRMFDAERQGYQANHQTYKEKQMAERRKLGKEYNVVYDALHRMFSTNDDGKRQTLEFALSGKGLDDEF